MEAERAVSHITAFAFRWPFVVLLSASTSFGSCIESFTPNGLTGRSSQPRTVLMLSLIRMRTSFVIRAVADLGLVRSFHVQL